MKFYLIVFTILCSIILNAQNIYELDQITVSGSKVPVSISNGSRDILIIDEFELQKFNNASIDYMLKELTGVDIRQRGTDGIQSDISIRGGTFEQTLIMIDGIKVSDPQTGHHNFNLPLNICDIQKIEVIKGQASKSFGPNAFSGVINIITKKFTGDETKLNLQAGSHNFYKTEFSLSNKFDNFYNRISFSKSKSDGYRRNTEYENMNFFYQTNYAVDNLQSLISFGYLDKDFGANSFYSAKFPNQAERTITKFATFQNSLIIKGLDISSKIFWRRNNDNFVLNKFEPSFYNNLHETNVYGTSLQAGFDYKTIKFTFGNEIKNEQIRSTNLGDHKRFSYGFFFESMSQINHQMKISIGGFLYSLDKSKLEFWPGFDLQYNLSEYFSLFASLGKAFRAPSFTELYYHDPITKSNPQLRREESINFDAGIKFGNISSSAEINYFRKNEKNLIDWVRNSDTEKWLASNISKVLVSGMEAKFELKPDSYLNNFFIKDIEINYTYLNVRKNFGYKFSKYALENLKHKIYAGLETELIADARMQIQFYYEKRENFNSQKWADLNLMKQWDDLSLSLKIKNAFNNRLTDFWSIELPRRTFVLCLSYGISY